MKRRVVLVALVVTVVFSGACGMDKAIEPYKDAKVERRDTSGAEVYSMPDGFSNFAGKCDGHGHRVLVAFKGDANRAAITAIDDPSCGK